MFDWNQKIIDLTNQRTNFVLATITKVQGSAPREPGTRMIVTPLEFMGTIGGGHLEEIVLSESRKLLLTSDRSQTLSIPLGAKAGQCCGGFVELFLEKFETRPEVFIFGAGHVGQALCQTLDETSFRAHLIDDREEWLSKGSLLKNVTTHLEDPLDFLSSYSFDLKNSFVVIMTYRHDLDENILFETLKREFHYVGLIGSNSKWERFKYRLAGRGTDPAQLERVHCPIGINIGDRKAPKEIAISIAGQLLKALET